MSAATPRAQLPEPPYYVVMFISQRTEGDDGYAAMADRMVERARRQPGFLGVESVRDAQGLGITLSYWRSEADILAWKQDAPHRDAQAKGRTQWYSRFEVRVARVERSYGFAAEGPAPA